MPKLHRSCFGGLGFVRECSECLSVDSSVDYVLFFFQSGCFRIFGHQPYLVLLSNPLRCR